MASVTGTPSIASRYGVCIRLFQRLCNLVVHDDEFSTQISLLALRDEFGRFRVWAGNVGAHREGKISLDHRLREASQVHKQVTELLSDLGRALQEAIAIVSHEKQPSDELSWSSDSSVSSLEDGSVVGLEDEMNLTTELEERFLEITQVITCLYRFSITICNPAPRDKLQKYAAIDISHYEFFDIQHASHKFPKAEKYLIDRLGKSNSRRRQLFKYHKKHHTKLAQYLNIPLAWPWDTSDVLPPNRDEAANHGRGLLDKDNQGLQDRRSNFRKGPTTIATTMNTQTTISTYVGPSDIIEVSSDAGQSQTSYATSVIGSTGSKLRVPPPKPDSTFDGKPFECPYCFSITIVRNAQFWMKHVFRDLRPYVCTFRDCLKPDRLFDSRHDWYNHELEVHRREWFCNACQQPFPTKLVFEDHLGKKHSGLFTETQLPAVADMCERAIDSESEQACPLCQETYFLPGLKSHLARHMQQLALFTLPKVAEERNGEGSNGDEGSVGAQASRPDEEKPEGSSLGSTNGDLASNSSQEIRKTISHAQNEIPDTKNETWSYLIKSKDFDDDGFQLESGTGAGVGGVNQSPYMMLSRAAEKLQLQTIENRKSSLGPEHPDTMASLASLASMYWDQGRWAEAEELQLQVVDGRKRILSEDHSSTLEAMEGLALMRLGQGHWQEAEQLQLVVMEGRQMHLGQDHPDTLAGKVNLALMFRSRGLLTEAEKLGLQALEGRKKLMGKAHPDTLAAIATLASTYRNQRRLKEAEDLERQVLEERTRVLDAGHPDILEAMEDLALTLGGQKRWAEALSLQVQVLEGRKRVLGENHLDTLNAIGNLASILRNQQCLVEAEELEVQVLEERERTLGKDHPDTLTAMNNLALTYRVQGRWPEVENLQVRVVTGRERVLGGDHPDTLEAIANQALTYLDQGQWGKAEEHQEQVIHARKRVLGHDHPDTLGAIADLALTYRSQKRWTRAAELEVQVMNGRKRTLGEAHPETLAAIGILASTYRRMSRFGEAEELEMQEMDGRKGVIGEDYPENRAAIDTQTLMDRNQRPWTHAETEELEDLVVYARRMVLGESHPDTVAAMANQVMRYWQQGRLMEAGELRQRAMSMGKGVLDSDQSALVIIRELALTYQKEGPWTEAEAEELQQLTVDARKKVLGGGHPDTLKAIACLASTHRKQGHWVEAERLQVEVVTRRKMGFGDDHPDTLEAVRNLESMYQNQGHLKEIEELENRVGIELDQAEDLHIACNASERDSSKGEAV